MQPSSQPSGQPTTQPIARLEDAKPSSKPRPIEGNVFDFGSNIVALTSTIAACFLCFCLFYFCWKRSRPQPEDVPQRTPAATLADVYSNNVIVEPEQNPIVEVTSASAAIVGTQVESERASNDVLSLSETTGEQRIEQASVRPPQSVSLHPLLVCKTRRRHAPLPSLAVHDPRVELAETATFSSEDDSASTSEASHMQKQEEQLFESTFATSSFGQAVPLEIVITPQFSPSKFSSSSCFACPTTHVSRFAASTASESGGSFATSSFGEKVPFEIVITRQGSPSKSTSPRRRPRLAFALDEFECAELTPTGFPLRPFRPRMCSTVAESFPSPHRDNKV